MMRGSRLWQIAILLSASLATSVPASSKIEELSDLPPGDQYRQLSLILMISGGADPALVASMESQNTNGSDSNVSPDDYKTPLIRIVDQESMLSGAAYLLNFARDSEDEIHARLATINKNNPILISMVDLSTITEDAIIIRNAIADAIGYSDLVNDAVVAAHLDNYRIKTIRIRNVMEFEQFDEDLDRLTEQAILSVGGKLDAYQRMFDEEVDSKQFDRQFDAAEYLYNRTDKFNEKAGILTEEIMKNVILQQSKPSKP
jgi:predicted nucleic acid-binding protein